MSLLRRSGVGLARCFQAGTRCLSTTSNLHAGKMWRLKKGLAPGGNEYGPLTDIPDWSYADGRPAPLGYKEKKRRESREALARRAVTLMEEMKFGRENHVRRSEEEQAEIEQKRKQRLEPKVPS